MSRNKKKKVKKIITSFGELYKRNRGKEAPKMFWSGIIKGSVGFIVGPAKSGKTILAENLAFAIVSGKNKFLGVPIELPKSKVLYISMEEDVNMRFTQRGNNQIRGYSREEKKLIKKNLYYSDEDFLRSIKDNKHWELLNNEIKKYQSNIIFVDSTNRFNVDIQDRLEANEMMQRFRALAEKYNCAIVLIHHTIKSQQDKAMTLEHMSGSSALSRDADFFIGVNRLSIGIRYIKFIDSRYYPTLDKCKVIEIQNNSLIDLVEESYEYELLKLTDGRVNNDNTEMVFEFINESVDDEGIIESKLLHFHFIEDNGLITKKTLYNQLKKLIKNELIEKVSHGKYRLIQNPLKKGKDI